MMHKTITALCGILSILAGPLFVRAASREVKIARSGATVLSATSPKGKAVVTIHTAIVGGSCAKACPSSRVWWDWGLKQGFIVEHLEISIGGHEVGVPLSVYSSMFAPLDATLRLEKGGFVLKVEGGDASESYFDLVYFNREGVSEMKTYSGEFPAHPAQVTNYYP